MKTRNVSKNLYKNYLQKAKEFLESSNDAFNKQHWNACVTNAIHSSISASDALTVFFKGVRHAGEKHEDVVQLLNTLGIG